MKKSINKWFIGAALIGVSASASAVAPGGSGCGWGNLVFEGKSGLPAHLLATLVNATSGNKTFGMTSGTNGCDTSGALTYDGKSLLAMKGMTDEVAQDMAVGHGEALTALSVSMGIKPDDRSYFDRVMHQHFAQVFPSQDLTAGQVMTNIHAVMKHDKRLQAYST